MFLDSEIWKIVIETEDHGILLRWAKEEKEAKTILKKESAKAKKKLIYGGYFAIPVQITKNGMVDFLNQQTAKYDNGKLIEILNSYVYD